MLQQLVLPSFESTVDITSVHNQHVFFVHTAAIKMETTAFSSSSPALMLFVPCKSMGE